ncbi:MAG TPA: TonB family protein [Pseudomonadales bacterium]|nr:TonB family protein [Pseudomonadales bacterium]
MSATRLRGGGLVLASLFLHALAIVGASTLALRAPVEPLFVDLTHDGAADIETRAGESQASSPRPEPAPGAGARARRASSPSSGAGAPAPASSAARPVTERPPDTSASPATTPPVVPSSAISMPTPEAPAPESEKPAGSPQVAVERPTVDPAAPPTESAHEPRPSGPSTLARGPASPSGESRPAGAGPEVGGDGAGPGMAAPGGARLVLALPGDGRGGVPAEYGPFLARFRRSVEDALVYPLAARRQRLAGRVELDVLLEPGGRVTAVEIHTSSSHGVLDEAGLAAVRSLPPMPLPEGLPRRPLRIRLPLDFQLR